MNASDSVLHGCRADHERSRPGLVPDRRHQGARSGCDDGSRRRGRSLHDCHDLVGVSGGDKLSSPTRSGFLQQNKINLFTMHISMHKNSGRGQGYIERRLGIYSGSW